MVRIVGNTNASFFTFTLMRLSRFGRSLTAWIASFAILVAALAPALAQAVSGVGGDREGRSLEVCTLAGVKHVPLAGAAADPTRDDAPLLTPQHCPYCSVQFGAFLPARAATAILALPAASQSIPALYLQAPRPLYAWAMPGPRAPPARV